MRWPSHVTVAVAVAAVHCPPWQRSTINQYASIGTNGSPNRPLDDAPLSLGFDQFRTSYDAVHGGFSMAPKFPRPVALNFLFRYQTRTNEVAAGEMALHTLRAMGEGGLFDQFEVVSITRDQVTLRRGDETLVLRQRNNGE